MGIHFLLRPIGIGVVFFLSPFLLFSACVTEDKFLYLNKKIDTLEAKTDKELVSNSERMAGNSAEMDRLKGEMRRLNGRLDENSHLLKRSIERDTTEGDSLGEGLSELREQMVRLTLRVNRISSYLGLEPMVPPTEKDTPAAPVAIHQVQGSAKPPAQPTSEIKIPPDQKLYDINMDIYH
ncbi:MAG: hypothetical protein JRD04_07630, partial [Deltaproteobacteria bacterium]|nr:hypothetical protein [Deltaproteobacteria bacterium]